MYLFSLNIILKNYEKLTDPRLKSPVYPITYPYLDE